jgi:hypothetical protein
MGMIPFDFWHRYSFADYTRKAFFFFKNKNESFKDEWERLRQLVHVTASVNGVKESAHEIMPFSWDKKTLQQKSKPITKEEVANILDRYKKILK